MTAQLLSGTCGSCGRWQSHELALKPADWEWHFSHSLVEANDMARSESSRVVVHTVFPQGWVEDIWISNTM